MAKKSYIGVDGTAREVKKWYIGAEDGTARKVKKGYVGVGGVARPFISGDELSYYGTITPLSVARSSLVGASVGNYALFAGGNGKTRVDAYNSSLSRSTPTALSRARYDLAGATVGDYALFAGGRYTSGSGDEGSSNVVDAYNSSLSRSTPTALSRARYDLAGATVGDYALFAGGYYTDADGNGSYRSNVNAYNSSLTRSTPTSLSVARCELVGATAGNYALFAGGWDDSTDYKTVDAYNSSLTRSTPTALSQTRIYSTGASVGEYALFVGGNNTNSASKVDAYNSSLTRITPTALSQARYYLAGATVGDYVIFAGGGYSSKFYDNVDVYNTSLVRTTIAPLSASRAHLAGASVGNYALFAGGGASSITYDTVDVYKVS